MPALNFQARWAEAVELGAQQATGMLPQPLALILPKRSTIRRPGRAKPGDWLYLYTGQRTKTCRKLGETLCLSITPVRFHENEACVQIGGRWWGGVGLDWLARVDTAGQLDGPAFVAFFKEAYGLPFEGELIVW